MGNPLNVASFFSFYLTWYFYIWFPVWGLRGITRAVSLCRTVWMTFTLVCQNGCFFQCFRSRRSQHFPQQDSITISQCRHKSPHLEEYKRKAFMRSPSWQKSKGHKNIDCSCKASCIIVFSCRTSSFQLIS